MLTNTQRQRFRALQQGEEDCTLSASEQAELQAFVQLIEDKEAVYLCPATERIRHEGLRIEKQNQELQVLVKRQERLERRLKRFLALSDSEQDKIRAGTSHPEREHHRGGAVVRASDRQIYAAIF